jgi:hypothetical protein
MDTSIRIGDVQRAVAKECLFFGDTSKENISTITKLYLNQLSKDGYNVRRHKQTLNSNATRVNSFINK